MRGIRWRGKYSRKWEEYEGEYGLDGWLSRKRNKREKGYKEGRSIYNKREI